MDIFSDIMRVIQGISYGADIAATIVALLISMVWYRPNVFGKTWRELVGLTQEDLISKRGRVAMLWNLPLTLFIAADIAALCKHFGYHTALQGFIMGYNLGLIICLFLGIHHLYEQRPLKLYAITAGYTIIAMSAMGMVITIIL